MSMATSLRFFSVTPQSLHRVGDGAGSAPTSLFAHSSVNPLPKLVSTLSHNGAKPISKFIRNVSISSEFDEDVAEKDAPGMGFSGFDEPSFSPDVKLFVGNLPFSVDSAGLAGLFEQAGNVEMVEVIYDKTTGRSRGFGFVTMSTMEEAEAAAQQFNGYELDGRALRVNSGPPPSKREGNFSFPGTRASPPRTDNLSFRGSRPRTPIDNTNRVHVGNLDWGVDDVDLETLFSKQGKVKEATVIYDRENGRSRGFGFVTYSSPEEVSNAIRSLDGIDLNGRSIRVSPAGAPSSSR